MKTKIGLLQLLESKKGTICLIIFFGSLISNFTNHLQSTAFAAIVSTIAIIYNYSATRMDMAALNRFGNNRHLDSDDNSQVQDPSNPYGIVGATNFHDENESIITQTTTVIPQQSKQK